MRGSDNLAVLFLNASDIEQAEDDAVGRDTNEVVEIASPPLAIVDGGDCCVVKVGRFGLHRLNGPGRGALRYFSRLRIALLTEGVWSVTVGPLKPEFWIYTFSVNGVTTLDPRDRRQQDDGMEALGAGGNMVRWIRGG